MLLGRGVQQDYQLCSAVVNSVEASACKVTVFDDSRSYRIGECQANFSDLIAVNSDWRIGTRLVIGGLQSSKMSHLNGLIVIVCPHKRHGHPCFITKNASVQGDTSWLTLCVRMEDPSKCSIAAVLLEPRFLSPCTQQPQPSPRSPSAYSLRKQVSMTRKTLIPSTPKAAVQAKTPSTPSSSGGSYQKNNSLTSTASGSSGDYQKQSSLTSASSAAALPRAASQYSGESSEKRPSITWKMPRPTSPFSSSSSYQKQHSTPSLGPSSYQKNLSSSSALSAGSCPKQMSLPSDDTCSLASSTGSSRRSASAASEAEKITTEELQQEVQDLRRMLLELTQGSQGPR